MARPYWFWFKAVTDYGDGRHHVKHLAYWLRPGAGIELSAGPAEGAAGGHAHRRGLWQRRGAPTAGKLSCRCYLTRPTACAWVATSTCRYCDRAGQARRLHPAPKFLAMGPWTSSDAQHGEVLPAESPGAPAPVCTQSSSISPGMHCR